MRTLHLLRHAEAQWQSPGPDGDHARPLSARGVAQARGVGAGLRDVGLDLILASSALRAQQTARALGLRAPIWSLDEIYNAGAGSILRQVQTVPDGFSRVLVVGHAPGIPALAQLLADSSSDAAAKSTIAFRYPPATLSTLTVHAGWSRLRSATLTAARIAPDPG